MQHAVIRTSEDLLALTRRAGILPFFRSAVPGWSVAEHIDPALWFTDAPGPWEWKGPLASEKRCVYGKFLRGRAAFVDPECFADLANWRRGGGDWECMVDEGLAPYRDRLLMSWLEEHPLALSRDARRLCGFATGYEAVLTRLQMQTYIVLADFRYDVTKKGVPYGWGNAVIELADRWLGPELLAVPEDRTPEESLARLVQRIRRAMPDADEALILRELR